MKVKLDIFNLQINKSHNQNLFSTFKHDLMKHGLKEATALFKNSADQIYRNFWGITEI